MTPLAEIASDIVRLCESGPLTDADVLGDLVQPSDRDSDYILAGGNYVYWYQIGAAFRPRRIVEIGTRYGYSMRAITYGASHPPRDLDITVFDNESCYGTPEPLTVFEEYFKSRLDITRLRINRVDTQTLTTLGLSGVDLAVVDADHSEQGCYHDCGLAFDVLRPGGILVVDDTLPGCVRDATERFCRERGLEFAFLSSLRGVHIIRKGL